VSVLAATRADAARRAPRKVGGSDQPDANLTPGPRPPFRWKRGRAHRGATGGRTQTWRQWQPRDDLDAIPKVTQALACLYLAMGEAPETVVIDAAGYAVAAGEERSDRVLCTGPADLVAHAGFRGSCPVRGSGAKVS
jgi:hypothetical protein